MTVGSMLTAGSGSLFTWFLRGVGAHGAYKITKGIVKKDEADIKDGVNSLLFVALNKLTSIVTNKVISIVVPRLYSFGAKALGEMGEQALAREFGTIKPSGTGSSMKTTLGPRFPDGIPEGSTIINTKSLFESKVGFQEYSGKVVNQVAKDFELLSTGKVEEVTWVFFRSPDTGKVGASAELLQELTKAGIKTEILGDIPKDIIQGAVVKYAPAIKK